MSDENGYKNFFKYQIQRCLNLKRQSFCEVHDLCSLNNTIILNIIDKQYSIELLQSLEHKSLMLKGNYKKLKVINRVNRK